MALLFDGIGRVSQGDRVGDMLWKWSVAGVSGRGRLMVPFDVPSDATLIHPSRILASGLQSSDGAGWLIDVHFGVDVSHAVPLLQAQIADAVLLNGVDPFRIWSNGSLLLLHDLVGNRILGGGIETGLGTLALVTVADASIMPVLGRPAEARSFRFFARDEGDGAIFGPDPDSGHPGAKSFHLRHDGQAWHIDDSLPRFLTVPGPAWWVGVMPQVEPSLQTVRIDVGGGVGPFHLVDSDDGSVHFVGIVNDSNGQAFSVPISSLVYGRRYHVISASLPGVSRSAPFCMYPQWPAASMPPGFADGSVYVRWDYPAVGNDAIAWDFRNPAAAGMSWMSVLVVGPWDFQGWPTVDSGLGFDVLGTQYGMLGPELGVVDPKGRGSAAFSLDVGSPVLQGVQIAFQFVGLVDFSGYVASDVVGVVLQ